MAIIKRKSKRGRTTYQVRVKSTASIQLPAKTFARRIEASAYERKLLDQSYRSGIEESLRARQMRMSDYFERWFSECRGEVSEGWLKDLHRNTTTYVLPYVGSVFLGEFTSSHVTCILERMRQLNFAEQTILHVYNLLHKAFEDAVHHFEFLDSNPVRRKCKPKVPKTHRTFLKVAQSRRLLSMSADHVLGPAVWLGLLTGMRPSEIQAVRFESVDFESRTISIRAAYKRKVRRLEPFPKQTNWGRCSMPPDLVEYLKLRSKGRGEQGFVASTDGEEMLSYDYFYKGLRKLCVEAGVPKVTPHELRHSHSEILIEAGGSIEDVRRQLNHSSLASTRPYIHRTDERLGLLTGRISAHQPTIFESSVIKRPLSDAVL